MSVCKCQSAAAAADATPQSVAAPVRWYCGVYPDRCWILHYISQSTVSHYLGYSVATDLAK